MKKHDLALIIMGIAILAITAATILLNGSPLDNRSKALDQQKVQTMDRYKQHVENYYSLQRTLPTSIAEAQSALSSIQTEIDSTIEYKVTSETEYQMCTTFESKSEDRAEGAFQNPAESGYRKSYHKAGYDCLEFMIPSYILNNSRNTMPPVREPAPQPIPVQ